MKQTKKTGPAPPPRLGGYLNTVLTLTLTLIRGLLLDNAKNGAQMLQMESKKCSETGLKRCWTGEWSRTRTWNTEHTPQHRAL